VRLTGKTIVVTGAGSGIGRACAELCAAEGAQVVVADLDGTSAREVAAAIRGLGGKADAAEVDVRDERAVVEMFDRVEAELGAIHGLANVAGVGSTTTAPDTPLEVWEEVFAVNARGVFLACKHAIPRMRAGGGSIVNMASIGGLVGLRRRAAYCASKGAIVALTRALALDHVSDGIRINCVCPGTVDTPWVARLIDAAGESRDELVARQPMGRLGKPEEIAEAVVYLASDAAGFVTGTAMVIDGGLTAG
jgi:NAD(P)-dependent dehydrogenase (short-subunit alcohol dehydrogenase family)